jgi:two-component system nitrate/nitrite sensor histidine kinase NarX
MVVKALMEQQRMSVRGAGDDPRVQSDDVPALDILSEIAASLANGNDVESTLERFLAATVDLAGAAGGAVRVLSGDGTELQLIGSVGLPRDVLLREQTVPHDCGTCGRAARDADVCQETELRICMLHTNSDYFGHRCRQIVAVPLKHRGRTLGVYNLFMECDREFSPELLALLRAIGELLGLALENERLARDNLRMSLTSERQMLANEVHDSLAQTLVYMNTRVSLLRDAMGEGDAPRSARYLDDLDRELANAQTALRELLTHFRVGMDPRGLLPALERLADDFFDRTGIRVEFANRVVDLDLGVDQEMQVFHIVQEALANIARHAHALRARLSLDRSGGRYEIAIEDDGGGMAPAASEPGTGVRSKPGHFGLSIMQERAKRLGGEVTVGPSAWQGTMVRLSFPAARKRIGPTP